MTLSDVLNGLAVPAGLVVSALASWVLTMLAGWLREKSKNERMARVADIAGRIAGEIHDKVAALPPGSNLAAVKQAAISTGVEDLRTRAGETIVALGGASDETLTGIVRGEVGKLAAASPPPILVPVPADITTAGTIPADPFSPSKVKLL